MTRVLVVSDDPHIKDEIEFGFPAGIDIAVVDNARSAWKWMGEAAPDAAVVDIHTGSAGGYGLTRDMALDPALAGVPVLMLVERVQDEWLARRAGADLVIVKPVSTARLARSAVSLIEGAKKP